MSSVTVLPSQRLPDTPAALRRLADMVARGEVTELVIAGVVNGSYFFDFPSSLKDSLVLASLLQARCVERFRE